MNFRKILILAKFHVTKCIQCMQQLTIMRFVTNEHTLNPRLSLVPSWLCKMEQLHSNCHDSHNKQMHLFLVRYTCGKSLWYSDVLQLFGVNIIPLQCVHHYNSKQYDNKRYVNYYGPFSLSGDIGLSILSYLGFYSAIKLSNMHEA